MKNIEQARAVSGEMLAGYEKKYAENRLLQVMTHALTKNSLENIAHVQSARRDTPFYFSVNLETLPVTNQKKSGRCWLFAGLNVLRERIAKQYRLEKFELSQNYTAFWDKFEKINYFLETVIELADRPIDDRVLAHVLQTGVQDGGQWDMFVSLVEKYGVVPKNAMDETYQSSDTGKMNDMIRQALTHDTAKLRRMFAQNADRAALATEKQKMLQELYGFLCACFGEPPKTFDFEYEDKDHHYGVVRGLTPVQFYRDYAGGDLDEFVSLINAPTQDKPYHHTYTVDYLGNVVGGRPILYLNVEMEALKNAAVAQLQGGEVVWFGSDVGKYGDRDEGIWDDRAYDYDGAFDIDFSASKEDGLDLRWSAMNHAMVITGVHLDEAGRPVRWKIENSWSDEHASKGYYTMSDTWFSRFVYQAVIRKKYLSRALLDELSLEPIHLHPWDPMGSLAE